MWHSAHQVAIVLKIGFRHSESFLKTQSKDYRYGNKQLRSQPTDKKCRLLIRQVDEKGKNLLEKKKMIELQVQAKASKMCNVVLTYPRHILTAIRGNS